MRVGGDLEINTGKKLVWKSATESTKVVHDGSKLFAESAHISGVYTQVVGRQQSGIASDLNDTAKINEIIDRLEKHGLISDCTAASGCTPPADSGATPVCLNGAAINYVGAIYAIADGTDTASYDSHCIFEGCTDPGASNYDAIASVDSGNCTFTNHTSII